MDNARERRNLNTRWRSGHEQCVASALGYLMVKEEAQEVRKTKDHSAQHIGWGLGSSGRQRRQGRGEGWGGEGK